MASIRFRSRSRRRALSVTAAAGALTLLASGCSLAHESDADSAQEGADSTSASGENGGNGGNGGEVVLVTHDSFDLPKKLLRQFEEETGYTLVHTPAGDGGELTSKLELTKDDPLGDVAFGVDNTYGAAALDADVFAPYDGTLPSFADDYLLPGDDDQQLVPVDTGSVCVNVDDAWFAAHDLTPPTSLDDLTDPAYADLFVTSSATASTPGMAFLLATIGEYGDDWQSYWTDLLDNGAKVVKGWEDAYYTDFSYSGGDRPIVLSYDTSPAYTVKDGKTSTSALLDTCFRQVEYVGVLDGAANAEGAQAVVDWLLSPQVQAALPGMYVFPIDPDAALPADWAKFAEQPTDPIEVDPADIAEHRAEWLTDWTDLISR